MKTLKARIIPSPDVRVRFKNLEPHVAGWAYKDDGLIEIDPRQSEKELLYTLVHEWLHCAIPSASEKTIIKMEMSLGGMIWKRGYRRTKRKKVGKKNNLTWINNSPFFS